MATPTTKALGRAVRALRTEQSLSQEDLAHKAEISVQYLSGIEGGHRNPTWVVLTRLAAGLNLPVSSLASRAERE